MSLSFPKPPPVLCADEEAILNVVNKARQGDDPSFTTLYEWYYTPIYRHLVRLVGNHDDASDLAIETFCKAWRGLSGLYDGRRFRSWLYRIATNLAIDHFRHKNYEQGFWRFSDEEDMEEPAIDYNNWIEEQELVQLALAQVASKPRKCLLLQMEGFGHEEIAAFVGLQKQSVGAYVSTGRKQFRQAYRQLVNR